MLSQTQWYNRGVAGLHDLDLDLKWYTKVNGKSLMYWNRSQLIMSVDLLIHKNLLYLAWRLEVRTNVGQFFILKITFVLSVNIKKKLVGFLSICLSLLLKNFKPCSFNFDTFFPIQKPLGLVWKLVQLSLITSHIPQERRLYRYKIFKQIKTWDCTGTEFYNKWRLEIM
jgi:hypothetical protein